MPPSQIVAFLVLGVVVGLASSLGGIGGGAVIIPALILLFGFTDIKEINGISLGAIVLISFSAAYGYWRNGHGNLQVSACIAVTGIIGAYFGSQWAHLMNKALLEKIVGMLLAGSGIYVAFIKPYVFHRASGQ